MRGMDEAELLELVRQEGGLARLETLVRQLQAVGVRRGAGDPNGVVAAPMGSLYTSSGGGAAVTFWVKEGGGSGNTGWVAK